MIGGPDFEGAAGRDTRLAGSTTRTQLTVRPSGFECPFIAHARSGRLAGDAAAPSQGWRSAARRPRAAVLLPAPAAFPSDQSASSNSSRHAATPSDQPDDASRDATRSTKSSARAASCAFRHLKMAGRTAGVFVYRVIQRECGLKTVRNRECQGSRRGDLGWTVGFTRIVSMVTVRQ